ncbi:Lamin-B receptor [Bienertia sinuspersici]
MKEDMKVRYDIVVGLRKCQRAKGKALNAVQSLMEKQYGILKPYLNELGLANAIHSIWPNIEHRQCARHIYSNWRKKHKGRELEKQFWRCVKATSSGEYETHMSKLKLLSKQAYDDFEARNPETFCKSKFKTHSCCDVESYEEQSRSECKWNEEDSETGFEVIHNGVGHAIDLGKRTCSCRSWDLIGIPCAHAMSAILYMNHQPEQYLAKWYTAETYEKTYQNLLQPVPGKTFWNHEGEGLPPSSNVAAKTWARGRKKGSKNRVVRPLPDLVQAEVPTPSTYQQQSRKGQGTAATTTGRGAVSSSTGWLEAARGWGRGKKGRGRSRGRGTPVGIGLIYGEGGTISFNGSGNEPPVVISHSQMSSQPTQ